MSFIFTLHQGSESTSSAHCSPCALDDSYPCTHKSAIMLSAPSPRSLCAWILTLSPSGFTPQTPAYCRLFKMCLELHSTLHACSGQHMAWPDDYLLNAGHCTFHNILWHSCHTVFGSYLTCSQLKHPDLFTLMQLVFFIPSVI